MLHVMCFAKKYMKQLTLKTISIILFLASVIQIALNIYSLINHTGLIDFTVYRQAVINFTSGKNPYNFLYPAANPYIPFNYPPSTLIIMSFLPAFSLKTAQIFFTCLSLLALWTGIWLTVKMMKIKMHWWQFLILLAFITQTFPVKFTLAMGQINLIVLGLCLISLYCYLRSKNSSGKSLPYVLSIILLAIASSLKLFPLSLLVIFLILGDYFYVASTSIIFIALNLILPESAAKYYFQVLPHLSQSVNFPSFYDQSLTAFFMRITSNVNATKFLTSGTVVILAAVILHHFFTRIKTTGKITMKQFGNSAVVLCFSQLLALISIGNVFSWQHHLVFSYPLILIVFFVFKNKFKSFTVYCLLFITWFLLAFHFPNDLSPLLKNPFIASYQTITIMMIILLSIKHSTLNNKQET